MFVYLSLNLIIHLLFIFSDLFLSHIQIRKYFPFPLFYSSFYFSGLIGLSLSCKLTEAESAATLSHLSISSSISSSSSSMSSDKLLPPLLLRRSRDSTSFSSSASTAVSTPISFYGSMPSSCKPSRPGSANNSLSPLGRTPSPTKRSGSYSPLVPLLRNPSNGPVVTHKRHSSPR